MMIVQQLFDILPPGFVAAPRVYLGKLFEIDVAAFESDEREIAQGTTQAQNGGVAVAAPPEPTLVLETELSPQDEFEVRVYDAELGRQLVAAIELVSPANKDRPENRRAFVAKVEALLTQGVCVSVVDLVTNRRFSLYAELLELIGGVDPQLGTNPPHLYSFTIRLRQGAGSRSLTELWHYPMSIGHALPTLPIWLSADTRVLLPLEPSYEETCRLLHIA